MQPANDVRTMMAAAEQAEARGDHAGAERLLRRALGLQEATLGPQHPEVANTLNNLAIVSEMNGKYAEAEDCYRRAFAIATASFAPGDPFVTTSRDNLEQFCAARGIPLKQTPPPASSPISTASSAPPTQPTSSAKQSPPAAFASVPQAASPAPPPRPAPLQAPKTAAPAPKAAASPPPRAVTPPPSLGDLPLRSSSAAPPASRTPFTVAATREPSRVPAIAAILAVLLVLGVGAWYLIQSKPAPAKDASTIPSSSAAPPPAPSSAPSTPAPEPVTEPAPIATDTTSATTPPAKPESAEPPPAAPTPSATIAPERPAATARTSSLKVVNADLCRNLTTGGAWNCAPATGTLAPGTIYFYTRVASGSDTTIQHRWYRDDRLHQSVPLRIRANPSGYRTYSRTGITAERAGKWKVELRAADGQLLDEKTFVVQP